MSQSEDFFLLKKINRVSLDQRAKLKTMISNIYLIESQKRSVVCTLRILHDPANPDVLGQPAQLRGLPST